MACHMLDGSLLLSYGANSRATVPIPDWYFCVPLFCFIFFFLQGKEKQRVRRKKPPEQKDKVSTFLTLNRCIRQSLSMHRNDPCPGDSPGLSEEGAKIEYFAELGKSSTTELQPLPDSAVFINFPVTPQLPVHRSLPASASASSAWIEGLCHHAHLAYVSPRE